MDDIGGTRIPLSDDPAIERDRADPPVTRHRSTGMRTLLGSLAVLLLVAAAIYYFAGRNPTDVAPQQQPRVAERLAETPAPRPSADNPAGQTALPAAGQSQPSAAPPPSPPQQSAAAAAPPAATPPVNQAEAPTSIPPAASGQQPAPMSNRATALPGNDEIMFVQPSRVNIRSEPGRKGRVIGTAVKGNQVKVIGRADNWVEVETDAGKGWISANLLGAHLPGTR